MARSTLFGYNVEEDDGKLVITINGLVAEGLIRSIAAEAQTGKGGESLARLLPIGSLYKMISGEKPKSQEETALTTEQIFSQNIDQTFQSFEQQIAEIRKSLVGVRSDDLESSESTVGGEKT